MSALGQFNRWINDRHELTGRYPERVKLSKCQRKALRAELRGVGAYPDESELPADLAGSKIWGVLILAREASE